MHTPLPGYRPVRANQLALRQSTCLAGNVGLRFAPHYLDIGRLEFLWGSWKVSAKERKNKAMETDRYAQLTGFMEWLRTRRLTSENRVPHYA